MTEWLTPSQQASWRSLVDGVGVLLTSVDRHLRDTHGLSLAEYEILVRLSEQPEHRARMSQLADEISHSRARVTQTVDRLAKAGLVRRQTCAEDRRGVEAALTDAGMAKLTAAAADHVTEVRRLVVDTVTDDELATMAAAFRKIRTVAAGRT